MQEVDNLKDQKGFSKQTNLIVLNSLLLKYD